jgi:8-oxo-dGTP pyrophosphatase MutT (NUDIX family)
MMTFKNKPNTCIKQDGKEYWISRSCAVVGIVGTIIDDEDYILVVKRGTGAADFIGKYCLPCGYIDWDESAYEAFQREVYEETGIEITPDIDLLNYGDSPFLVRSDPKNNRQNISLYFSILINSNNKLPETSLEHTEPNEIEEAIWIKVGEVDKYDFCFDHDNIIKNYYEIS